MRLTRCALREPLDHEGSGERSVVYTAGENCTELTLDGEVVCIRTKREALLVPMAMVRYVVEAPGVAKARGRT